MKKQLCCWLLPLLAVPIFAQRSLEKGPKPKIVEPIQVRFNLLSPGIDFELGLFKDQTITGGLGLGFAYYQEGYALTQSTDITITSRRGYGTIRSLQEILGTTLAQRVLYFLTP